MKIKMKKLAYIFMMLFVISCDKELDIKPTQSIDQESALATAQDVKVTLIGSYDGMGDGDVYGGGFAFTSELLADEREVLFGGTFSAMDEIWNKALTAGNAQILSTWRDAYIAINRANNVLSALSKLTGDDVKKVEGEARFIRGSVYFGLVGLFGKAWGDGDNNANLAVPLVTAPTRSVTDQDNKPRASVAAIYAQVIEDISKAAELLPADPGENRAFASKDAATALLARIYLIQGNFAAARDAANKVITGGKFELASSFAEVFDDQSGGYGSEVLFGTFVNEQDGVNSMNTYYAPAAFGGRGDVRVQNKHIALYDAADPRGKFFNTASNRLFTNKHADQFGDVPLIRLAEMYLIRAETNFRLNTKIGAQPSEDIAAIRTRAGAPQLSAAITLERILAERRLELAFEGLLLSDVKRLKRNVGTLPFSDPKLVCPIPQREIDTNKSLTQNPGY